SSADVAIAVARMHSRARNPGRPTAKRKRGGRFLGKSAHHRRPSQLTAIAQNNGGTRGTISGADAAFCERTGGASLRRRGSAPGGERLAGTLAPFAATGGDATGASTPGCTADRAHQCDQQLSPPCANPVAGTFPIEQLGGKRVGHRSGWRLCADGF